eukprot:5980839-Prymnesium_polylepis.1
MCGGRERDWDGVFAAALPHLIPGYSSLVSSIICDKNSSIERRTPSPSPPMSACQGWGRGVTGLRAA